LDWQDLLIHSSQYQGGFAKLDLASAVMLACSKFITYGTGKTC